MANGIFKGINLGGPLSMHEENISHPSQVGLWKAFIQTFPHSVSLAELEELLVISFCKMKPLICLEGAQGKKSQKYSYHRVSMEVIVTSCCKLVYFTYLGVKGHPTYLYRGERSSIYIQYQQDNPVPNGGE